MFIGLLHFHSLLRWVLLILLIVVVIKAIRGRNGGIQFSKGDKKLSLFTMISAHLQLILGGFLYAVSPTVQNAISNMGAAMKDGVARFWAVEHILMMIIAIAFLTIGHIKCKKAKGDEAKFKAQALYFTLGLILILASIPWPFREVGFGRGWF
ncbi:MAG: cytochrome B [Bacteroidetes bacterium]|nr:cytochrome B [Bacteroidota bacterium]